MYVQGDIETELSNMSVKEAHEQPNAGLQFGAGVAKFRRKAAKAGSVMEMSKAERHAYADSIEKAIRAKHRTLHVRPAPSPTAGWYSPPSIARLLRYESPLPMAGDPRWERKQDGQDWARRQEAVYAAMIAAKNKMPWEIAA